MSPFRKAAGQLLNHQPLRFLAVGMLNTLFGYCMFSALVLAGLKPAMALLAGTVMGLLFNYFTTGRLVFGARGLGSLPKFVAVYGLAFLVNLWGLQALIAAGLSPLLAQAIVLPMVIVMTFLFNKLLVFRGAT